MEITIDTHALIWFTDDELYSRLSSTARRQLGNAEASGLIHVPIIALTEVLHLSEKRRIRSSFERIYKMILESENYRIIPFTRDVLEIAVALNGLETHDRIILASAIFAKTPLISRDVALREYDKRVLW
jgi:PIN domain nuclease of toxin-antitoxin system